jgi:hypothetical protein
MKVKGGGVVFKGVGLGLQVCFIILGLKTVLGFRQSVLGALLVFVLWGSGLTIHVERVEALKMTSIARSIVDYNQGFDLL